MGAAARERAKALYDWALVIASYQELFAELQKQRKRATSPPMRSAANPWRRNPFELFAGYSTRVMQRGLRLRATPRAGAAVGDVPGVDLMALDLVQLRGRAPCDTPAARALLKQIARAGTTGIAYEELIRPEIGEPAALICFNLGWLMKLGLVELMV